MVPRDGMEPAVALRRHTVAALYEMVPRDGMEPAVALRRHTVAALYEMVPRDGIEPPTRGFSIRTRQTPSIQDNKKQQIKQ